MSQRQHEKDGFNAFGGYSTLYQLPLVVAACGSRSVGQPGHPALPAEDSCFLHLYTFAEAAWGFYGLEI